MADTYELPDRTIEHYARLIVIMADELNIPIPQSTADGLLYTWLNDQEVLKYLHQEKEEEELNVMKIHEEISGTEDEESSQEVSPNNSPTDTKKTTNTKISTKAKDSLKYLKDNPDSKISFNQQNFKKPGSASHARYEKYKTATTYNEFKELNGTSGDITNDFDRYYLELHGEDAPKLPPKNI